MSTYPGMEAAFPIILSAYYCGVGISMIYAAMVGSSIRVATIPSMVFHFGTIHGLVFGEFLVINKQKMHPSQLLLLHGIIGILSMITYFLIAVAMSPTKKKTKTNKRTINSRLKKTQ
jgi:Na+/H+ antiporter NhaC